MAEGSQSVLSRAQVLEIVDRFAALNPYDKRKVSGSILKIEDENFEGGQHRQLYDLVISAKRYALFNRDPSGGFTIRKYSEHGLGYLLNPIDPDAESRNWAKHICELIIAQALGQTVVFPCWFDRPALSRITVTSPNVLRSLTKDGRPFADRVKPFNFVLAAHVAPFGHPPGVDPKRFQLIAQYASDPRQWPHLGWTEVHSGQRYGITTGENIGTRLVRVKSYRDVFEDYETHPEPKSAGPDGMPSGRSTRGLLGRLHVRPTSISYVTKESHRLDDVGKGVVHDVDEVCEAYVDPQNDPWLALVVPILRLIPRKELARAAGVSERAIQAARNGHSRPRARRRALLTRAAARYARAQLGPDAPADDLAACASFLCGQQGRLRASPRG